MDLSRLYAVFIAWPNISNDTRKIMPGSIYWAIKGERFDGNTFTAQALEKGAAYAVVDDPEYVLNDRCLLVDDSLTALQQLAAYHRKQLGIKLVAITGSNGKTTTKELLHKVLSKKYKTFATPGNLNNHIGLPLSLLQLTKEHEIAVIELGANHQGENAFLCGICSPDTGIITNMGKDHLEGFGGMDGVEKANTELFDSLRKNNGFAFVNADDERVLRNSGGLQKITYAMQNKADIYGKIVSKFPFLKAEIKDSREAQSISVQSHLFGSFNMYNLLAATAVGKHFDVPADDIKEALESYIPQNNRSQLIEKDGNTYILDAYNANPSSMGPAVKDFAEYPATKKVLVLGDMFELGEDSAAEHKAMAEGIDYTKFEKVIFAGEAFYELKDKYPALFFKTTDEAKHWLQNNSTTGATFYLKGSRGMKLEALLT